MQLIRSLALATIFAAAAPLLGQPALQQPEFGPEFRGAYGFSSPFMRDARQYDRQSPLGYPAAETREVLFSRARTLLARYEMRRAQERIHEQVDRMRRAFRRSSDYVAAKEAEDAAWADYQSAVTSVLARLMSDSKYQAHSSLTADLAAQIRDVQLELQDAPPPGRPVDPDLLALARAKLGYAGKVSALRAAALAGDPAVVEARARLMVAAERTVRMRRDFVESVQDDETMLALRERHSTARANAVAAAAYESLARQLSRGVVHYAHRLITSGRAYYDHGYFENYNWPIFSSSDAPMIGQGPINEFNQNGYGFRRR